MSRRVESEFVTLDRSLCEACWECIAVCPQTVLGKIELFGHRHAVINAGDRCAGCQRCVKVCTSGALAPRDDRPAGEVARVNQVQTKPPEASAVSGPARA
jgi:NAD-dependent dihydropyrimidine dehydrogenase PreA subunit